MISFSAKLYIYPHKKPLGSSSKQTNMDSAGQICQSQKSHLFKQVQTFIGTCHESS